MLDIKSTIKTENSARLIEEARQFSPGGVQGQGRWYDPFPLFIKKTLGARIWDVDDNEYIDYHASYGPAVLGYNDPRVRAAVIETMETEGVLSATPHPKEVQLAKLVAEVVPCAEKTIFCGGGGSDAVYNSVRVARAYTGKTKILKFEGGYHGWHDYLAVSVLPELADAGPAEDPNTVPVSAGSLKETVQKVVVAPFNNHEATERIIEREKDNLAAVMIEPGYSAGCPLIKQDFLQLLRDLCDKHGIVLIFDEMITGFRTHIGGGQALLGVTPDLGIFGKAMCNGWPLSALAGKKEIMSLFTPEGPVFYSGTYTGHILGVTASLKTIEILRDGEVHKKLWRLGDKITHGINAVIDELEINAQCHNFGSIWGIYFTREDPDSYRKIASMVRYDRGDPKGAALKTTLLNNGIFVTNSPRGFISAAHSDEDIDWTIDVIGGFFREHRAELV